jgi:CubicO group peptidase (beta-lactamase class C family)
MAGDQIVPAGFIDQLLAPDSNGSQAYHRQHRDDVFPSGRYKNHFWIVAPHRRQLSMIGIHGQFAWCDPDNDLLVVGLGSYPKQDGTLMVSVLKDLWEKLSQQVSKR